MITELEISIVSIPEFNINLTLEEVRAIQAIAALHYDSVCKRAGEQGGFIYGWVNRLTPPDPLSFVTATHRQLDTVCKILEMARYYDDGKFWLRSCQLTSQFQHALRFANTAFGKMRIVVPDRVDGLLGLTAVPNCQGCGQRMIKVAAGWDCDCGAG